MPSRPALLLRNSCVRLQDVLHHHLSLRVLATALLLSATFYLAVNAWDSTGKHLVHSGYRVLSATFLFLVVASFGNRVATGVLWVMLVGAFAVNRIHFDLFGTRVTMGGFYSMLDTDGREATEFLSLVPWHAWLVVVVFSVLAFLALRALHAAAVSRRFALTAWIVLLIVPFGVALKREQIRYDILTNPLTISSNVYKGVPLFGDIVLTAAYYHEKQALDDLKTTSPPPFLRRPAVIDGPELMTVIIGESSSRHHYSVYGYPYPTTPFLDGLEDDPRFVALTNAVSPSNLTRESLKRALTFATVDDASPYRRYWSVIDLARAAGYYTVWVSNQAAVGSEDTIVGAIAHLADETYFISQELGGDKMDIALAERYAEVLRRAGGRKVFVVLHMIGSHYRYETRSEPVDKQYIATTGSPTAAYDATIFHTDRMLERVIGETEADPRSAAVLFFSDHGEEVRMGAHGLPSITTVQVDVPLLAWFDSEDTAPLERAALRANRQAAFSTQDMIYLFADVMGWEFDTGTDRILSGSGYRSRVPQVLKPDGSVVAYSGDTGRPAPEAPTFSVRPRVALVTPHAR